MIDEELPELSWTDLKAELQEKTRDLEAFQRAREIIRARVLEVRDSKNRLTPLPYWSGTDAVLGSLDLSIHAMERTVEELKVLLRKAERGLHVVRRGDEE